MANEAQREYWNGPAGQKWVAFQAELDARLQDVSARLLRAAAIRPGERLLDVGCGAGATLLEAAAQTGTGGSAVGVDISEPLLARARARVDAAGLGNVVLLAADAQTHAFSPEEFDLVYSRFGVMFFEDPVAAFANLRRALAPGGRLCFVCWRALHENPWFAAPLKAAVRRLGPPEPQPPRAPGPLAFAEAGYVASILDRAGFAKVRICHEDAVVCGQSGVDQEAAFAVAMGPAARLIEARGADPATRAEIVAETAEALRRYTTPEGLRTPAALYCVLARRQ